MTPLHTPTLPAAAPNGQATPAVITAFRATQVANFYALMNLSDLIGSDYNPEFVAGPRPYWSVPLVFTMGRLGRLGGIGTLRVDAITEEVVSDAEAEKEMMSRARELAERALSSAGT